MATIGAATVTYLLVARADFAAGGTRAVVALALAGGVVVMLTAVVGADSATRAVQQRVGALHSTGNRGQDQIRGLVEQLRRGERPLPQDPAARPAADGDAFELLLHELSRSRPGVGAAEAGPGSPPAPAPSVASEQKAEVFVSLARRLQSLVHREIQLLDELENQVEDPDLLKGLFHVDHLATRIRRHAESLAVLGGAVSRRQWSRPVSMTEVLRSAVAEVEQYSRVKLVPPIEGKLQGHAVADVIHLVAELVENATVFSAPNTQVLLRAQNVTAGLAIEVEDRGLGMPADGRDRVNTLLTDPDQANATELLKDGRIGLYVVSALARRHGAAVRLQSNIYGGVQAVVVLPHAMLGADSQEDAPQSRPGPAYPAQALPGGSGDVQAVAAQHHPATAGPGSGPPPAQSHADARAPQDDTSRPQLPHRRQQTHSAPRSRETPDVRRDSFEGHDPGLMAAFQRGVSLAETAPEEDDGRHRRTDGNS